MTHERSDMSSSDVKFDLPAPGVVRATHIPTGKSAVSTTWSGALIALRMRPS